MAVVIFLIFMCVALNSPTAGLPPRDELGIYSYISCPKGSVLTDDRCYTLFKTLKTWHQAQTDCKNRRGNLISVRNSDDLLIVQQMMGLPGLKSVWVGGTDAVTGLWRWSDGEPFSWTFWSPGQPDNIGDEDCMSVHTGGNAHDEQCYMKHPYICYRELQI